MSRGAPSDELRQHRENIYLLKQKMDSPNIELVSRLYMHRYVVFQIWRAEHSKSTGALHATWSRECRRFELLYPLRTSRIFGDRADLAHREFGKDLQPDLQAKG